jgi:hypothetical protein
MKIEVSAPLHEKKPTFGQEYIKGIQTDSGKANVKEIRQGMLSEWDKNMFELIEKTRKILKTEKFYIKVTQKRERLVNKTMRNYFESCYACPSPDCQQVVYKIREHSNDWQLLWVIPNEDACRYLMFNALRLPPSERELLQYVMDFSAGKLEEFVKKENGEIIQ